jgi:hypothetical protein
MGAGRVPAGSRGVLRTLLSSGVLLAVLACGREASREADPPAVSCAAPEARSVVATFGERLRLVSTLAPDSLVRRDIQNRYGDLVTPDLLATWLARPMDAPGRQGSSPWPARIALEPLHSLWDGQCEGTGVVVFATSEDTMGVSGRQDSVTVRLTRDATWRISDYRQAGPSGLARSVPDSGSVEAAVAVLSEYYRAISVRDFERAYRTWARDGTASGQTMDEFAAGFAQTKRSELVKAVPGRIEGAAGSRFLDVDVVVEAVASEPQTFEGTYTLRRTEVDGATPEQRRWHIESAKLRQVH